MVQYLEAPLTWFVESSSESLPFDLDLRFAAVYRLIPLRSNFTLVPSSLTMTFSSRFAGFRSSEALILVTICTAMFTDGFTYGIVTPVFPFLLQDENLVINNNGMQYPTTIRYL
jgi:hypothetical protein